MFMTITITIVLIMVIIIVIREMKEELATVRGKESEVNHKKGDLEKQLEVKMMVMSGDEDDHIGGRLKHPKLEED